MAKHAPTPATVSRVRNAVEALRRGDTRACAQAITTGQSEEIRHLIGGIQADIELAAMCLRKTARGCHFDHRKLYPKGYEYLAEAWPPRP